MQLYNYVGKDIKITCVDGQIIEGRCVGYTQDIDNTPEISSIYIGNTEIYENEIEKIETLT